MGRAKLTREEKRIRRKLIKDNKKYFKNEIKAQRRARLFGIVAAIGLMSIFDKRRK